MVSRMQALRFLFSPSGRLAPRAFVLAAVAIYAAGLASQALTTRDVLARAGLWPFAIAQALLIWMWFVFHARRLRDAGRSVGAAAGVSVLYALSVLLLLLVAAAFIDFLTPQSSDPSATSALGFILLVAIVAILSGSSNYDIVWVIVALLTTMALVPVVLSLALTIWAASRPSAAAQPQ